MKFILGVDAGNTKTIALVARPNGHIVGWGRGGCGDIYNAGSVGLALKNIAEAVRAAMTMAGAGSDDFYSVAFSMAGADWPEDFALLQKALKTTYRAPRFTLVNDALGALSAGASSDWGVAIACGTGAGVSARSPQGKSWHSSFWQDGGGARSLGANALSAVYKAHLQILPATALTEKVLAFYGEESVEALLHRFTRRNLPQPANVALLARLVLDAASGGDQVATSIVIKEGRDLADYALAAARQVGIKDANFPLVLAGSIFKHSSTLLPEAILARIKENLVAVQLIKSELEPSAGALVIARKAMTRKVSANLRSKLKSTLPPQDFFAT